MSFLPKIAAVFATMNRAATAVSCIRALAGQTRPPELVVVADNVSDDDTVAAMEALADLPFELIVHKMRANRGNAGGVEEAMDLAFSNGADAVWILDDDSWPRMGALAALLSELWDPEVVRHALQIDPRTGRFTWPMWIETDCGWKLTFEENELPDGPIVSTKSSWTGALISKEIRKQTGPVNGTLFIRGEDEEYPWRISMKGFRFECVQNAVIDHPGPEDLIHLRIFGRNFFFERGLADWKLYYKVRNMVWLKRRQSGNLRAFAMALAYALATSWIDGARRLPLVWEAASDGWSGKLGKRDLKERGCLAHGGHETGK
jgi:rhamnopyranosyl-N-acetylglucosaminyl-diphospho-decaprenol beta-1,3/1,4-galactofuranosyltransferase